MVPYAVVAATVALAASSTHRVLPPAGTDDGVDLWNVITALEDEVIAIVAPERAFTRAFRKALEKTARAREGDAFYRKAIADLVEQEGKLARQLSALRKRQDRSRRPAAAAVAGPWVLTAAVNEWQL